MGDNQINIANDHNQDHIMGERDNHIDQCKSLSPEDELLTHGHGERDRVVDGEVQPRGDEGDGGIGGDGHGGGHSPWGQWPLAPFFFLGDGADVEIDLPLKTAAKGEGISWCPLTQGSTLYKDSRIPVIQITSSVERASREHTYSNWAKFYIQKQEKKFSRTLQFKVFPSEVVFWRS